MPADVEVFSKLTQKTSQLINQERSPPAIEFGGFEIETWFSSSFPEEYARLPKIFMCEFCLQYMKSKFTFVRHINKCTWRNPPGNEIYRSGDISVFEVDGKSNKGYSQNLCLLAKLFLDSKTLFLDVEPFFFYVLTKNDRKGNHFVGYFSKEKICLQKFNVSCILTLPNYQRQGLGRFLIDFSYLLSKTEGLLGTPETPLSSLGQLSYQAYWKSVVMEYLQSNRRGPFSFASISKATSLEHQDIAQTFLLLGFLKCQQNDGKDSAALCIDWRKVDAYIERSKNSKSKIQIDQERLRWTPFILNPTINDSDVETKINESVISSDSDINYSGTNPTINDSDVETEINESIISSDSEVICSGTNVNLRKICSDESECELPGNSIQNSNNSFRPSLTPPDSVEDFSCHRWSTTLGPSNILKLKRLHS